MKLARTFLFNLILVLSAVTILNGALVRAYAQDFTFLQIAGPGSPGDLATPGAFTTPTLDGDFVIFRTRGSNGVVNRIWSYEISTNTYRNLVSTDMAAPGGTGNFIDLESSFGGPFARDGFVVFGARDSATGLPSPALPTGIFTVPVAGGPITRIANYNTSVPGGIGNFFDFRRLTGQPSGNFSTSEGRVVLNAEFGGPPIGNSGVYSAEVTGANLAPVADSLHPFSPPPFEIKNFSHPTIEGDNVAFIGGTVFGAAGIYTKVIPSAVTTFSELVSATTPNLPGGNGGVLRFLIPSLQLKDGVVSFMADDLNGFTRRGLYHIPFSGGAIDQVISNQDTLPDIGAIHPNGLRSYATSGGKYLMHVRGLSGQTAIFLENNGVFKTVLKDNQVVNGTTIYQPMEVQPGSIQGDRMVIGTSGCFSLCAYVYLVSPFMPTPAPTIAPTASAIPIDPQLLTAKNLLAQGLALISTAKKTKPARPSSSLSRSKRKSIIARRTTITNARNQLKGVISSLIALQQLSGVQIRSGLATFTSANLESLKKAVNKGISKNEKDPKTAKSNWKKATKLFRSIAA